MTLAAVGQNAREQYRGKIRGRVAEGINDIRAGAKRGAVNRVDEVLEIDLSLLEPIYRRGIHAIGDAVRIGRTLLQIGGIGVMAHHAKLNVVGAVRAMKRQPVILTMTV